MRWDETRQAKRNAMRQNKKKMRRDKEKQDETKWDSIRWERKIEEMKQYGTRPNKRQNEM